MSEKWQELILAVDIRARSYDSDADGGSFSDGVYYNVSGNNSMGELFYNATEYILLWFNIGEEVGSTGRREQEPDGVVAEFEAADKNPLCRSAS